jgi:methionyl-tRNA formyltransferase
MSRAYYPWPGIFTVWQEQTLKIIKTEAVAADITPQTPGTVIAAKINGQERLLIATGEGWLAPIELQLPGKKVVNFFDFMRGQGGIIGAQLG